MKQDNKESLKEQITTLRDDNKHLFVIAFALITGSFTLLLQVADGDKGVFMAAVAIVGIVGLKPAVGKFLENRDKIDQLIEKLKDL